MRKKIEILAPAKNLYQGMAAINAGADAVYMGAHLFGARTNATNSVADIAEMVKYAHLFKAKVLDLSIPSCMTTNWKPVGNLSGSCTTSV